MRRPEANPDGTPDTTWERVQITYEMLAVDRAQTVLRYWNWSFTADAQHIETVTLDDPDLELRLARRNAALLFHRNG